MTKRGTTLKRKSAAPQGRGALTMELSLARRMPAEWERHEATWIAWPHHEPDWPGKLAPIPWVYAEIVRALSEFERVEILCHNDAVAANARLLLSAHGVMNKPEQYRQNIAPYDRVFEKTVSNMQEVAARGGNIILMTDAKGADEATIESLVTIVLPDMAATFTPMVYAVPVQLLAYHTAVVMGTDVDQPRNLAKSVTVE